MIDPDVTPVPVLEEVFLLDLAMGEELPIGRVATGGLRTVQAVLGGKLEGGTLAVRVIGGSETGLARGDGVTPIEAVYLLEDAAGLRIRIVGTGVRLVDGPFTGTRMSLVFEADESGPYAALADRAFVAERALDEARMRIARID